MKQYKVLRIKDLEQVIKPLGFFIQNVNYRFDDGDFERKMSAYVLTKKEIRTYYEYCFMIREVSVEFTDGRKQSFVGENLHSDTETLTYECKNHLVSPNFQIRGEYILSNEYLERWLDYNGVSYQILFIEEDEVLRFPKIGRPEWDQDGNQFVVWDDRGMELNIDEVLRTFEKIPEKSLEESQLLEKVIYTLRHFAK